MKSSDILYDFVGLFFTESENAAKFQVRLGTECLQKASQNPRCLINMKLGWGALTPHESSLERTNDLNSDGLPPSGLGQVRPHFQTTVRSLATLSACGKPEGVWEIREAGPCPGGGRVCQPLLVGTNMPTVLSRTSPMPEPSAAAALGVRGLSGLAFLSSFSFLDAA